MRNVILLRKAPWELCVKGFIAALILIIGCLDFVLGCFPILYISIFKKDYIDYDPYSARLCDNDTLVIIRDCRGL